VNIDERLALLAEKHEALTQTLELMLQEHRDWLQEHRDLLQEHRDFVSRMTRYSADVRDAIARLANIAAAHDQRLDDQEKRIEKLDS
jgi:hypothetical protein